MARLDRLTTAKAVAQLGATLSRTDLPPPIFADPFEKLRA